MTTTNLTRGLVIIDPQNCFMDLPGMPLSVLGATKDMDRLAAHLKRFGWDGRYERVYVTVDTHPLDHISHAVRWVDADGNHPASFTIITAEAYEAGIWRAAQASDAAWQGEYLRRLSRPHCIWPVHGQAGEDEYLVYQGLSDVLISQEPDTFLNSQVGALKMVYKGMHRDVEQFGAFGADVPYPGAPETEINQKLIDSINQLDEVVFAGEASSHCVMDSVNQFLTHVSQSDWQKVVVLRDCMSPVPQPPGGPDFPAMAEAWFLYLQNHGVRVQTLADYERTL